MQRSTFLNVASLLAAAPAFLAATPSIAAPGEPVFTPDEIRADLKMAWATMIDVSPDPFFSSNRQQVEALYHHTLASLTRPMTERELFIPLASVFGALNCGHVGLSFSKRLNSAAFRFPLEIDLTDDNSVIVTEDVSRTIPFGSTLVSVNGVSAARIRDLTFAMEGAETPALRRTKIPDSSAWPTIALCGPGPTYDVAWTTPDGKSVSGNIARPAKVTQASDEGRLANPYTFSAIHHGRVGYLNYLSCEDVPRMKTFIADVVADMRAAGIRDLIIDIRNNRGGDSRVSDEMWRCLSAKPFKQIGGFICKSSRLLKRRTGYEQYLTSYGSEAWHAPNGAIMRYIEGPDTDLVSPAAAENRFTGSVYLFISAGTFSSGMNCAVAAKDYGLATLVGEETGEPVISAGELFDFDTPNVGLGVFVPTKLFEGPKPHPPNQGVLPDIHVATSPADKAAKRDPVLERTLALIDAKIAS
jgi:hypothetical protein